MTEVCAANSNTAASDLCVRKCEGSVRTSALGSDAASHVDLATSARSLSANLCRSHLNVDVNQDLQSTALVDFSIFRSIDTSDKERLIDLAAGDLVAGRAMGAMLGMAVADSVGHQFEFLPVCTCGHHFNPETLEFTGAMNRFQLKLGQWTDDTSMGLCLADSLLVCNGYNGSDMRVRFWNWWNRAYNNAFRLDDDRRRKTSVGLGGNISESLDAIGSDVPPPRVKSEGQDAGNGSLMRLAPVAIYFHKHIELTIRACQESSYTTHPGDIAANACGFLGFLIARAMTRSSASGGEDTMKCFLDQCVNEYLERPEMKSQTLLAKLLCSAEPVGSKERCWNWRDPSGPFLQETLIARGHLTGQSYNGYPVSAGYFGSYSMDGLAIALHCLYHSESFSDAIARCVNFLGDADSTGAICGQIAGAFYGMKAIDQRLVSYVHQWDQGEIALRAALLAALGPSKCDAEGHWLLQLAQRAEDALTLEQREAEELKMEGNKLYKQKMFVEALAMYDRAIEKEPHELTYHSNKCAVWIEMGEEHYSKVLELCRDLVGRRSGINAVNPGGASCAKVAKVWSRMASVLERQEKWDEARKAYVMCLTQDYNPQMATKLKKLTREHASALVLDGLRP